MGKRAKAARELKQLRKERRYLRILIDLFEPPDSQFLRLLKEGHKPNGWVAMENPDGKR